MDIIIPLGFIFLVFSFSIFAKYIKKTNSTKLDFLLNPKSLNWFLVAFSAGATANTGFIVTAAIAMGFSMGLNSLLLPISFLLGDLVYWQFFAIKVHNYASAYNSRTISDFITSGLKGKTIKLKALISFCIIFSAIMYTIAQWNAAGKVFSGFYNFSVLECLIIFSCIVLAYSIIGGFLSSVYADIIQGIFMIILSTVTILVCVVQIPNLSAEFNPLLKEFMTSFRFWSENGIVFILGWVCASIGFSFSQPHIIDKIIAAKDGANVMKARFVYMFFVQYTWIGMTFLGILIKIVYKNINFQESEKILAIFISLNSSSFLKGVIISGVFATIASTASSLIISISNYLSSDFFIYNSFLKRINQRYILIFVFFVTILPSIFLVNSHVFDLTIFAVSLGAVLAPCMLIKILNIPHNRNSLIFCIIFSLCVTIGFKYFGVSENILYDIPVGTFMGLIINFIVYKKLK